MKKKIIIILVSICLIWFWCGINHVKITCGIEVLVNEEEYKSIIDLVKSDLYEPKENYDCVYIYIHNNDIVIDWVNNNHDVEGLIYCDGLIGEYELEEKYKDRIEEVVSRKTESLDNYPELKEAVKNNLLTGNIKNYDRICFAFDQNGKMVAQLPFKQVIYNKKDLDNGKFFKAVSTYNLYYIEKDFSKELFNESWIRYIEKFWWKPEWGH